MAAPRIALIAGEASGDTLGAGLITALKKRYPDAEFVGVGGPQMAAAGQQIWADCEQLAVMGLFEVLRHLPRLLKLRRELRQRLLALRPDLFIGIDAPDFNLGLERKLRQAGLRTLHYVSPSIWAWRQGRAAKIGQSADAVLCLLPFEPALYSAYGVKAHFVGHPLADQMPLQAGHAAARQHLGLDPSSRVLAVLPGSRHGEIKRLAPAFLDAAQRLQASDPELQVLAPMANAACRQHFETLLKHHTPALRLRCVDGEAGAVMSAADAVLVASGTAALEAMLCHRPMVVAYRIAGLTHALIRGLRMIRTPWVSLPNALAGRMLVPEYLQQRCTGELLAPALSALLEPGSSSAREQTAAFTELHQQLRQDASERAASVAAAMLQGEPQG